MSGPRALVGNAADESQIATAKRKERLRRERELEDLRSVLGSPAGRRLLWRLLGECHVFESIWRASAEIHFLEGKRNVGLFLLHEIHEARPEALLQMMQEAQHDSEDSDV